VAVIMKSRRVVIAATLNERFADFIRLFGKQHGCRVSSAEKAVGKGGRRPVGPECRVISLQ